MWIAPRARQPTVSCPSCGGSASRVHSTYMRRLADRPLDGRRVLLRLRVRRFFRDNGPCSRRTMAEQVSSLTARYRRRTTALARMVQAIGLALGGRAGARAAPDAIQVAGRWHLLYSLVRAVERTAHQHRVCLRKDAGIDDLDQRQAPSDPASLTALIGPPEPSDPPGGQLLARVRQWHTDIHQLRERGWTISTIADRLGRDRKTVRHYLTTDLDQILASARERRPNGHINRFKPYLQQRFLGGATNAAATKLTASGADAVLANTSDALTIDGGGTASTAGPGRFGMPHALVIIACIVTAAILASLGMIVQDVRLLIGGAGGIGTTIVAVVVAGRPRGAGRASRLVRAYLSSRN